MKKYPIFALQGIEYDLDDGSQLRALAGRADDYARAPLLKVLSEATDARGWAIPWRDGPIVMPGESQVRVQPFTAYKSQTGAPFNPGTEDAATSSDNAPIDSIDDVVSAWFPGGASPPITASPASGNMRWDLLYAIVADTDSDSASRVVVDPTTLVGASNTVNTRHKSTVTLAWAQGTEASTGASSYGAPPALPPPDEGHAHIPLAFVRVQHSATMGTQQYGKDEIADCSTLARINPQTGAVISAAAGVCGKKTGGALAGIGCDAVSLINTAVADGGWPLSGASTRPVRLVEAVAGGPELWIQIGPFNSSGTGIFDGTFRVLPQPIAKFGDAEYRRDALPFDWRHRFFDSVLHGDYTNKLANDPTGSASNGIVPSAIFPAAVSGKEGGVRSLGQSRRETSGELPGFSLAEIPGYCVVGFWDQTFASGDYLALVVSSSTGYLHLAGKHGSQLNNTVGVIHMKASGQFFPLF